MALRSAPAAVCPRFHKAVELVGRRWTGAILSTMLAGATRFTDIVHAVPGLSDRLLSERLKELENEGIVVRQVHPDTPVRIEYLLTEKGRALSCVTEAVSIWADKWVELESPSDCPACDEHATTTTTVEGAKLAIANA